eukprot:scaffold5941_cov157-Ochromonas_danica.AAC.1
MNEKEKASGVNLVNLVSKPGQADHTESDDYGEFFSQSSTAMGCSANFGQPNVGGASLKGSAETDDYEVSDKDGEFETVAMAEGTGVIVRDSRTYTDPKGDEIKETFALSETSPGKLIRGGLIKRTIEANGRTQGDKTIAKYKFGNPHDVPAYNKRHKEFYAEALRAFMDIFNPGGGFANVPKSFTFTFRKYDFTATSDESEDYRNSFKCDTA